MLVDAGRHQRVARVGAGTITRDLQQIRAARESTRTVHRNLPHALRVNVPLADLGTSPNLALTALTDRLRFVTGFHVYPEVAQLEVLLIHLEIRVVFKAPIHLDSARIKLISANYLIRFSLFLPTLNARRQTRLLN
jgi:hypothetical protein